MKCDVCGDKAEFYIHIIIDADGETDYIDRYRCTDDSGLPHKGDQIAPGRRVIEARKDRLK